MLKYIMIFHVIWYTFNNVGKEGLHKAMNGADRFYELVFLMKQEKWLTLINMGNSLIEERKKSINLVYGN